MSISFSIQRDILLDPDRFLDRMKSILSNKPREQYLSPEEQAKQNRIDLLLFILSLIKIDSIFEVLLLVYSFAFYLPEKLTLKPTRSARITPFIYFP